VRTATTVIEAVRICNVSIPLETFTYPRDAVFFSLGRAAYSGVQSDRTVSVV
jgi:hypothetical protein